MSTERTPLLLPEPSAEGLLVGQLLPPNESFWSLNWRWGLALILLATMALLGLPPFIAQSVANHANLEVVSVAIHSPTNTSFTTHLASVLNLPLALPVKISGFRAGMAYGGRKLGWINIPERHIYSRSSQLNLSGQFEVENSAALGTFCQRILQDANVPLTVTGRVQLSVLGLPISGIVLQQVVALKGAHGMRQVTLRSLELPGIHPLGGVKVRAHAVLVNPTNTSVSLGALTYGLEYRGLSVAQVEVKDLKLVPGLNSLDLSGRLFAQAEDQSLSIVSEMVSKFLQGDQLDITVRGLAVLPSVTWLNEAISKHVVDIPFTSPTPTGLVSSISFPSLSAEFTPERAYAPLLGASFNVRINPPFAFPFNITSLTGNMTLVSTGADSDAIAQLAIPDTRANLLRSGNNFTIVSRFDGVPFKVLPDEISHRRFESFLVGMVYNQSSEAIVSGNISASTVSAIGPLRLTNIALGARVAFPGLSGLQDPPPSLSELNVTGVDGDTVQFKARVRLTNPTQFSGGLGDVRLGIWYSGSQVGNVAMLGLRVGANATSEVDAVGSFLLPRCHPHGCDTREDRLRQQFLADYVAGNRITVNGVGDEDSTSIASLKPALSGLNCSMSVPRAPEFLQGGEFKLLKRGVVLELANPLAGVTVRILALRADASHGGTELGTIDVDFTAFNDPIRNPRGQPPIVLPPNSTVKTSPLPVKVKPVGWRVIRSALDGTLLVNVTAEATLSLYADGGHPIFLNVNKLNVATQIHL